jgi:phosphoribosylanthranilate isomerase
MMEFKDKVDWNRISKYQKLSEDFIREFKDEVCWDLISIYQKLSEDFIREFKGKVNWNLISIYQKLSEDFIREFKGKVNWNLISKYQKLSEDFIREFKDEVNWNYISTYQKLSEEFIKEHDLKEPNNSWLYASVSEKLKYIKENTSYEIIDDTHILAYKSVRECGHSVFNWQYLYEVGETCQSHCDCNTQEQNSFGLSAWTKEKALEYHGGGKILKVKIPISKIGAIVHDNNKIRCFEFEVLEEIK